MSLHLLWQKWTYFERPWYGPPRKFQDRILGASLAASPSGLQAALLHWERLYCAFEYLRAFLVVE